MPKKVPHYKHRERQLLACACGSGVGPRGSQRLTARCIKWRVCVSGSECNCRKAEPMLAAPAQRVFPATRSYQGRKTYRFCAIHRVVGVTTARSTQGFQEALQSVYRIGFPKTDRPIFAHTREKLECLDSRRCFGDSWDKPKENIRIRNRVADIGGSTIANVQADVVRLLSGWT
jgi:hypothetical protein